MGSRKPEPIRIAILAPATITLADHEIAERDRQLREVLLRVRDRLMKERAQG